jgi:hypothetical protein
MQRRRESAREKMKRVHPLRLRREAIETSLRAKNQLAQRKCPRGTRGHFEDRWMFVAD